MSLSIDKLNDLLREKNLTIRDYYVYKEELQFVSVFSEVCSTLIFIEIPYEYEFDLPQRYHIIEKIDEKDYDENAEDEKEIAEEYGGNPDPLETEKHYASISLDNQVSEQHQEPDDLKEKYKRSIQLKKLVTEDRLLINCINRQLERL